MRKYLHWASQIMNIYEPKELSSWTVPQCSRSSSWKELSSSWISSGQGQSSPALKFNRMLICRKKTNNTFRRAQSGDGNIKMCLKEQEGRGERRRNAQTSTQWCEGMNNSRMGIQKGKHHYYSHYYLTSV